MSSTMFNSNKLNQADFRNNESSMKQFLSGNDSVRYNLRDYPCLGRNQYVVRCFLGMASLLTIFVSVEMLDNPALPGLTELTDLPPFPWLALGARQRSNFHFSPPPFSHRAFSIQK